MYLQYDVTTLQTPVARRHAVVVHGRDVALAGVGVALHAEAEPTVPPAVQLHRHHLERTMALSINKRRRTVFSSAVQLYHHDLNGP